MIQKLKNYYHLFQAIVANIYYGFPARKAIVIGVTGTDGKTTTTSIIYHILKSSGKKVAMITSVGAYIGEKVYGIGFHVTTPSPFGLQYFLRKAVDAGCEYIVLETTSHALDQNRVWGVSYKIGVLTNITHEHLDYHKTYTVYTKAKFKLLTSSEYQIVNRDDESFANFCRIMPQFISADSQSKFYQPSIPKTIEVRKSSPKKEVKSEKFPYLTAQKQTCFTYSLKNSQADFTPTKFPFKTQLIGEFNIYNSLAAVAACKILDVSDAEIRRALLSFTPPPGRQEIIFDKDFRVMIDFAHTPNAFLEILPEVKKMTKGKLIHLFGSAGKRDFTKRPEMGESSAKYSDIIILTSEDPRDEKVEDIDAQIKQGISANFKFYTSNEVRSSHNNSRTTSLNNKSVIEIPDRKEAIDFAISLAKKGDTVLLTGKSHEKSMNLGNGEQPWDEFAVANQALLSTHAS